MQAVVSDIVILLYATEQNKKIKKKIPSIHVGTGDHVFELTLNQVT